MPALSQRATVQFNDVDGMPLLTRREEEEVLLVADGIRNADIDKTLNIAKHSIRSYLYRILDKLGISSRVASSVHIQQTQPQHLINHAIATCVGDDWHYLCRTIAKFFILQLLGLESFRAIC